MYSGKLLKILLAKNTQVLNTVTEFSAALSPFLPQLCRSNLFPYSDKCKALVFVVGFLFCFGVGGGGCRFGFVCFFNFLLWLKNISFGCQLFFHSLHFGVLINELN